MPGTCQTYDGGRVAQNKKKESKIEKIIECKIGLSVERRREPVMTEGTLDFTGVKLQYRL